MARQPEPTPDDTTPPEPRLRKVPGTTDETGLAIIRRAVTLRLATLGGMDQDDAAQTGETIVAICRKYLIDESARLSGKGGASNG
jgi:hypothetical protein